MENEIVKVEVQSDLLSAEQTRIHFERLQSFVKTQMRDGQDFGIIPGCKRPSLYKPGAEKLLFFHGLGCLPVSTSETVLDWKTPFFNYCYRATVYRLRDRQTICACEGSCNSLESKYRYLWVPESRIPKGINAEDLESKDGRYRIENSEIFNLVNTISKMAQKRAIVGATLIACRASDIFTQAETPEEEAATRANPGATQTAAAPQPATESTRGQAPAGSPISEPQARRLWAIRTNAKCPEERFTELMIQAYPYAVDGNKKVRAEWIKRSDYEAICKMVEAK